MKWETLEGFWVEQCYDRTCHRINDSAVCTAARVDIRRALEINKVRNDGGDQKERDSSGGGTADPALPEHQKRCSCCYLWWGGCRKNRFGRDNPELTFGYEEYTASDKKLNKWWSSPPSKAVKRFKGALPEPFLRNRKTDFLWPVLAH